MEFGSSRVLMFWSQISIFIGIENVCFSRDRQEKVATPLNDKQRFLPKLYKGLRLR